VSREAERGARGGNGSAGPDHEGRARASDHLAFVAHEVRNRLATALWSSELLGRLPPEERAGARGAQLAQRTHRALERLGRLLEDHLLAARLAAGGIDLRLADVPLGEALAEARALAGTQGAREEHPSPIRLRADRELLVRALGALLARAGRDGAAVLVVAGVDGPAAVVSLAGAAVVDEELAPPGRGAASDPEGRSLGLLLAGAVARAHGGALAVADGALRLSWPLAPR
jgi:K+-sensing histidine kinase KdpD